MMTLWDWVIVLSLNGAIIAYGFYISRGTSSSSEWFLGGRSLPWWALGLSMFATSVDNADLVSITGHVYNNGMSVLTVFTLAAVLGSCLAAFGIVPVMYRAGFYTNAEYLEVRFCGVLRLFSALIQIQYRTAVLGLMVWSIYLMLHHMIGLDDWQAWGLIVSLVILTAAYTVWGGLASVVWTDALQSLIIMVGALCIFGAVWNAVGGWSGLEAKLAALPDPEWNAEKGWIGSSEPIALHDEHAEAPRAQPLANWLHIGRFDDPKEKTSPWIVLVAWIIIGLGYYTVNHTQTMRMMGARSLWDMKIAALVGAALGVPLMLMVVLMGVCGRALYPELTADGGTADGLFPLLSRQYLTTGFKGLVVAGIISATISTFDSMGSALSALFTRDVYARWIRQNQTDEHYLKVGRWATIGILLIGFLYLPFIISQRNMVDATLSLVSVFVTPLFTIYLLGALTRVHARSGLIGLLVGGIFGVSCFLQRENISAQWMPYALFGRWYVYLWSVLLTASSMFLATAFWGRSAPRLVRHTPHNSSSKAGGSLSTDIRQPTESDWLANSSEQLPPIKEHPFKGEIPRCLQPRWFALVLIAFTTWLVTVCFW